MYGASASQKGQGGDVAKEGHAAEYQRQPDTSIKTVEAIAQRYELEVIPTKARRTQADRDPRELAQQQEAAKAAAKIAAAEAEAAAAR